MDKQIIMRSCYGKLPSLPGGWGELNRSLILVSNSGVIVAGRFHGRIIGSLIHYEVLREKDE